MVVHSQTAHVSVAHRYWNLQWSESENLQAYGRLASEVGVGSNLEICLTAPLIVDLQGPLKKLKQLVDHRCLYLDHPEFHSLPSTCEAIAQFLASNIEVEWTRLTVRENKNFAVTVKPGVSELWVEERAFNLVSCAQVPVDADSKLAWSRGLLDKALRKVAPLFAEAHPGEDEKAWGERFAQALVPSLPGLVEVLIDIGGQRFLRIQI